MKYLYPAIKGIHYEYPILAVDEQSGGQLKLSRARASFSEVIKQVPLAIEDLPKGISPGTRPPGVELSQHQTENINETDGDKA